MEKTKLMNTRVPVAIINRVSEMYRERKVTLEKSAELAEVSVRELINHLREKEQEIGNLSAQDLDEDIKRMYERAA